jgi:hypothetical protein
MIGMTTAARPCRFPAFRELKEEFTRYFCDSLIFQDLLNNIIITTERHEKQFITNHLLFCGFHWYEALCEKTKVYYSANKVKQFGSSWFDVCGFNDKRKLIGFEMKRKVLTEVHKCSCETIMYCLISFGVLIIFVLSCPNSNFSHLIDLSDDLLFHLFFSFS